MVVNNNNNNNNNSWPWCVQQGISRALSAAAGRPRECELREKQSQRLPLASPPLVLTLFFASAPDPQRSAWSRCLLRCCSCCLCCLDTHLRHLHQVGLHAARDAPRGCGWARLGGQGSSCRSGSVSAGSCNCFRLLVPAVMVTPALLCRGRGRAATHGGKWPARLCSGKLSWGH